MKIIAAVDGGSARETEAKSDTGWMPVLEFHEEREPAAAGVGSDAFLATNDSNTSQNPGCMGRQEK